MRDPTIINAPPVAHPGMEAKMGAKKMEMKNMIPTTIAVMPVLPPSDIECELHMPRYKQCIRKPYH